MDERDEYVAVESAGKLAGISPRTLRYWIKNGKLPAIEGQHGRLVNLAEVRSLAALTGKAAGNTATALGVLRGVQEGTQDTEHLAAAGTPVTTTTKNDGGQRQAPAGGLRPQAAR